MLAEIGTPGETERELLCSLRQCLPLSDEYGTGYFTQHMVRVTRL